MKYNLVEMEYQIILRIYQTGGNTPGNYRNLLDNYEHFRNLCSYENFVRIVRKHGFSLPNNVYKLRNQAA